MAGRPNQSTAHWSAPNGIANAANMHQQFPMNGIPLGGMQSQQIMWMQQQQQQQQQQQPMMPQGWQQQQHSVVHGTSIAENPVIPRREKKVLAIVNVQTGKPVVQPATDNDNEGDEVASTSTDSTARKQLEAAPSLGEDKKLAAAAAQAEPAASGPKPAAPRKWSEMDDDDDDDGHLEVPLDLAGLALPTEAVEETPPATEEERVEMTKQLLNELCANDRLQGAAVDALCIKVAGSLRPLVRCGEQTAAMVARLVWAKGVSADPCPARCVKMASLMWDGDSEVEQCFRRALLGACQTEFMRVTQNDKPLTAEERRRMVLNARMVGDMFSHHLLQGPALVKAADEVVSRAVNLTISDAASAAAGECAFVVISAAGQRLDETDHGKKWVDVWLHKMSVTTRKDVQRAGATLKARRENGWAIPKAAEPDHTGAKKPFNKKGPRDGNGHPGRRGERVDNKPRWEGREARPQKGGGKR